MATHGGLPYIYAGAAAGGILWPCSSSLRGCCCLAAAKECCTSRRAVVGLAAQSETSGIRNIRKKRDHAVHTQMLAGVC